MPWEALEAVLDWGWGSGCPQKVEFTIIKDPGPGLQWTRFKSLFSFFNPCNLL